MERQYPGIEFEAEVQADGTIKIPPNLAAKLHRGAAVTVRVMQGVVTESLRGKNVTEAEIEEIAMVQLEQRENVVRFLKAGGSLSGNRRFQRRSEALLGGKG